MFHFRNRCCLTATVARLRFQVAALRRAGGRGEFMFDNEFESNVDNVADDSADAMVDTSADAEACSVLDKPVHHILIIDDDHSQTEVLAHRFGTQGYRVTVANTCRDGEASARADRPDLILLDITLPDRSGLEVCSELCDDSETSDIPVIIVSGADKPDVVRESRAAGCHFFVRKPYDPNALLTLSQTAIAESRW